MQQYVPVVGKTGKPLMPTTNTNANKLLAKGKAVRQDYDELRECLALTRRCLGQFPPSIRRGLAREEGQRDDDDARHAATRPEGGRP